MFLIRLWHYLKGYVIIIVSGTSVERFINICTRRQILLWDMERLDKTAVRMKISIQGFRKARPAARKSRCRIRIGEKSVLPDVIGRYRKRKGFLVGILFFAILIYLMTSIIWSIEITGNQKVETKVLTDQLNSLGIYRGASKRIIDPKLAADTLMLKNRELSWVGVEIKGIHLRISIREGIEPPRLIPFDKPCNIVAKRDGIILTIQPKKGLAIVKEGDTVVKGQVIISGNLESVHPEFGTKQVHALGEVAARTWYEIKREVPVKKIVRTRTGQEWNKYSVYFLDFIIPVPRGEVPFEKYETGIFDRARVIANRFRLPVGLTIQRFFELHEEEHTLEKEEAREIAREAALKELNEKIPPEAKRIDQQIQLVSEEGGEFITITVECTEDIAMEQEIGGN